MSGGRAAVGVRADIGVRAAEFTAARPLRVRE